MRSFFLQHARSTSYPGPFEALCEIIGEGKAQILVEHFGGVSLYIPAKVRADHPLASIIGLDTAQRVCAEFGGVTVGIPRHAGLQRNARNAQIFFDHEQGMSNRELARKYQLTDRHIRSIINSSPHRLASNDQTPKATS